MDYREHPNPRWLSSARQVKEVLHRRVGCAGNSRPINMFRPQLSALIELLRISGDPRGWRPKRTRDANRGQPGSQKMSPARRGAVLSVLPDMPFDPEPYITSQFRRCSLLERWPRSRGGGNLFAATLLGNKGRRKNSGGSRATRVLTRACVRERHVLGRAIVPVGIEHRSWSSRLCLHRSLFSTC
jgi:hypothetical protein